MLHTQVYKIPTGGNLEEISVRSLKKYYFLHSFTSLFRVFFRLICSPGTGHSCDKICVVFFLGGGKGGNTFRHTKQLLLTNIHGEGSGMLSGVRGGGPIIVHVGLELISKSITSLSVTTTNQ